MDAPKGRYSVIEKGGRLIVIDNGTGAPLPSTLVQPGRGRGSSPAPSVVRTEAGPLDRAAELLLAIVARRRDPQGRAVIAWEWRENGKVRRWDAALDETQQKRLGRALLGLVAPPPLVVLVTMAEGVLLLPALVAAAPPMLWSWLSLRRLRRETHDPSLQA
ncbi:MAG TPA: hypothetical protein VF759_08910 [Allosphingosinicella sp.]|jgi:hypothetical protein